MSNVPPTPVAPIWRIRARFSFGAGKPKTLRWFVQAYTGYAATQVVASKLGQPNVVEYEVKRWKRPTLPKGEQLTVPGQV